MRSYYKNMHVSLISYQVIRFITVFFTECWQSFWQTWACLFPIVFHLFMLFRTMTTRYLQCVVLYINLNVWFLIAYSISGCVVLYVRLRNCSENIPLFEKQNLDWQIIMFFLPLKNSFLSLCSLSVCF